MRAVGEPNGKVASAEAKVIYRACSASPFRLRVVQQAAPSHYTLNSFAFPLTFPCVSFSMGGPIRDPDTSRPLGSREHTAHAAPWACSPNLAVIITGVCITRDEALALRHQALLPLPKPRITAPRADNEALGMEHMRRHSKGVSCLWRYIRSADEAGDDGGSGAGASVGVSSYSSGAHMKPGWSNRSPTSLSMASMSERTDVPSGQTHFFRCGWPLLWLLAWHVAGSCLPCAFGVGKGGESVLGAALVRQ